MTAILSCTELSRHFGALRAVDGVSIQVEPGARHAVIGPNGAGKSTLLQLLSGVQRVSRGSVRLDGRDVTGMSESGRSRLGLSQTFQHSSLFATMTARQNIALALCRLRGVRAWPQPRLQRRIDSRADELLDVVGLPDQAHARVGELAHGQRRQLEIGVALACEPRVLLLDEPAAGLSPGESALLGDLLERLSHDVTVVFVEHDLDVVFRLATRVSVLHLGRELLTGSPTAVRASSAVQAAYLGRAAENTELFLPPEDDSATTEKSGGRNVSPRA